MKLARGAIRCALIGLLFSCANNPQSLLAEADALQRQQHQQLQKRFPHRTLPEVDETVAFSEQFYVPTLTQTVVEKPAWYSQRVDADMRGIPLHKALQQVLVPLGLRLYIADEVDQQALVYADHQGTLGDLLQWIANAQQLIIEPFPARVEVKQRAVRQFDVSFLAGDTGFMLGEQEQRRDGDDESSQYLNFAAQQLSLWSDLEQALQLMLSERGQLAINQSSTSVVVKDTPTVIAAVEQYIQQLNHDLTRQVAIDVQVIEVSFNDQEQYSIDWQLLRNAQVTGPFSGLLSGADGAANSKPLTLNVQKTTGRWQGSQVFIDALQEQGTVRVSHHPRVITLNNQVARLLVEDETSYLASSGSTSTPNVGTEQLLIPDKVTTGFELFLLPNIQQHEVILQISSSLSALRGLDTVQSGQQSIQTPRTSRKTFFLKAMVGHQQTLLLSGLQQSRTESRQQQGFLSWLAGGEQRQQLNNSETLLLLTPHIVGANL